MRRRRNRVQRSLLALSGVAVLWGSAVFACTNLATINLSTPVGRPGDAVTVTGSGFQASSDDMAMDGMVMGEVGAGGTATMGTTAGLVVRSQVVLHWNGPDGPALADAIPDRSGTVSVLFTIPETRSGQYTVVAVQKNIQGYDVYGTPARAPIQVIGVGQPAGNVLRGAGPEGAGGQSNSTGMILLTAGLGVMGIGLLAGGLASTRLARGRRAVPAKVAGPGNMDRAGSPAD